MTEDTDLFSTLKDDYREALEHFNDALLRLENEPEDRDSIERASRQLHNIKGFANRMRAPKLGQLAHILEDVLVAVNEYRLPFGETLANLLFDGMDLFVHYLRSRDVPSDKVAELVEEVEPLLFAAMEHETAAKDMEPLLPDFIAAALDNVEAINRGLSTLEKEPANKESLQEVYRNAHSLKGSAMTIERATLYGVPLVAGTDAMAGFTLHRELELYRQAGISNADVLRIATIGAARVAGAALEAGSIEPGKRADFVLLARNPLEDIGAVRRPLAVFKGDRWYDPAQLYEAVGIRPFTR